MWTGPGQMWREVAWVQLNLLEGPRGGHAPWDPSLALPTQGLRLPMPLRVALCTVPCHRGGGTGPPHLAQTVGSRQKAGVSTVACSLGPVISALNLGWGGAWMSPGGDSMQGARGAAG